MASSERGAQGRKLGSKRALRTRVTAPTHHDGAEGLHYGRRHEVFGRDELQALHERSKSLPRSEETSPQTRADGAGGACRRADSVASGSSLVAGTRLPLAVLLVLDDVRLFRGATSQGGHEGDGVVSRQPRCTHHLGVHGRQRPVAHLRPLGVTGRAASVVLGAPREPGGWHQDSLETSYRSAGAAPKVQRAP